MIKAKLLRAGIGWGMLVVIAQSCATGEEVETRTSALSPDDRPAGLVCGLAYSGQMVNEPGIWPLVPGLTPVDGKCLGKSTIKANPYRVVNGAGGPTADGYGFGHEGDNGLNRLWTVYLGYQSQFLGVSTGDAEYASSLLMLPKGAACGFKFTCGGNGGNGGSNCMSYNPQWECPPGWQQRQANDANSSSGCNFAWCEYQDPHGACSPTTPDCYNAMPSGMTCGITDSDYPDVHNNPKLAAGHCLDRITKAPNSCPPGWEWHGRYDAGRSSGHGLAWCSKP